MAVGIQRRRALRQWALAAAMAALARPGLLVLVLAAPALAWAFQWWALPGPPLICLLLGLFGRAVDPGPLPGRALRPDQEPELAALVARVAERMEVRAPLLVRVTPGPDAALTTARVSGRRVLVLLLGLPLLRGLPAAELAAVVAHELAHARHIRPAGHRPPGHRRTACLLAARDMLADRLQDRLRPPARLSARLLAATRGEAWAAESAADADAARAVGTRAVRDALRRTEPVEAAFAAFAEPWYETLAEDDAYPADLYDALEAAMRDPHVARRMSAAAQEADHLAGLDPASSHPPLDRRIAALPDHPAPCPGAAGSPADPHRPVALRSADALQQWCALDLAHTAPDDALRPVRILDTPPERLRIPADDARRALQDATDSACPDLAAALALQAVEDGTWPDLAHALDPGLARLLPPLRAAAARQALAGCLGHVLSAALLDAGWNRAGRWTSSTLTAPDGTTVDLHALLTHALDTGDTTAVRPLLHAAEPETAA